jgi:hypothetical protein
MLWCFNNVVRERAQDMIWMIDLTREFCSGRSDFKSARPKWVMYVVVQIQPKPRRHSCLLPISSCFLCDDVWLPASGILQMYFRKWTSFSRTQFGLKKSSGRSTRLEYLDWDARCIHRKDATDRSIRVVRPFLGHLQTFTTVTRHLNEKYLHSSASSSFLLEKSTCILPTKASPPAEESWWHHQHNYSRGSAPEKNQMTISIPIHKLGIGYSWEFKTGHNVTQNKKEDSTEHNSGHWSWLQRAKT